MSENTKFIKFTVIPIFFGFMFEIMSTKIIKMIQVKNNFQIYFKSFAFLSMTSHQGFAFKLFAMTNVFNKF